VRAASALPPSVPGEAIYLDQPDAAEITPGATDTQSGPGLISRVRRLLGAKA